MLPGVSEAMQEIAKSQGKDWDETLKKWKKAGQWHIEVPGFGCPGHEHFPRSVDEIGSPKKSSGRYIASMRHF